MHRPPEPRCADLITLRREADEYGVTFEFVIQEFPDSDEGELLTFIMGYSANKVHASIRGRMSNGKARRRAKGYITVGPSARYGYVFSSDKTRYRIDEVAAYEDDISSSEIVRMIFRWASEGVSARQIGKRLTAMGVPTPGDYRRSPQERHGGKWVGGTVCEILKDPMYTGRYAFMRARYQRENGKYHKTDAKPEELEWFTTRREGDQEVPICPKLVSVELWETTNNILTNAKTRTTRNNSDPTRYLLRGGFIRCGYCGRALIGGKIPSKSERLIYKSNLHCRDSDHCPCLSKDAAKFDGLVWAIVEEKLRDPESIARDIDQMRARSSDPTAVEMPIVKAEIKAATAECDDLDARWIKETRERFRRLLEANIEIIDLRIASLIARQVQLEAERAAWAVAQSNLAEFTDRVRAVRERLGNLDDEDKRRGLEIFGVELRVWQENHDPEWEVTLRVKGVILDAEDVTVSSSTSTTWTGAPVPGIPGWRRATGH